MRSQYTIGYTPTNKAHDGSYRKIKMEMKNKDYSALTRRGYYAPEQNRLQLDAPYGRSARLTGVARLRGGTGTE